MGSFDLTWLSSASTARTYPVEVGELRTAVEEAIEGLPGWTLVNTTNAEIRAVSKTRVFGFEDDVTISLSEMMGSGATRNTRAAFSSASRLGLWDLGQNRRNLQELLVAIDRNLNATRKQA